MAKKMKLNDLKVESFRTDESHAVQGGIVVIATVVAFHIGYAIGQEINEYMGWE